MSNHERLAGVGNMVVRAGRSGASGQYCGVVRRGGHVLYSTGRLSGTEALARAFNKAEAWALGQLAIEKRVRLAVGEWVDNEGRSYRVLQVSGRGRNRMALVSIAHEGVTRHLDYRRFLRRGVRMVKAAAVPGVPDC